MFDLHVLKISFVNYKKIIPYDITVFQIGKLRRSKHSKKSFRMMHQQFFDFKQHSL